jgi:hypothetical protein
VTGKKLQISPANNSSGPATQANEAGRTRMLRLGTPPPNSREMDLDDIFVSRLKLLLLMGKAYLDDFPMAELRRQAILENAQHIETESIDLGRLIADGPFQHTSSGSMDFDHVFYQRVKLLAVMMKAIAKGYPMGEHRKKALMENMDIICQTLAFSSQAGMDLLRVA